MTAERPTSLTEEQRRKVAAVKWFHRIQLGEVETPGRNNKVHQDWVSAHLPASMADRSVLDIGAWDGYYSFLAESRGAARVLAIDEIQNPAAHLGGTEGFEVAKEILRSKVEYRVMSAKDLDQVTDTFDIILFLGVYYHVKDPMDILVKIRRRLRPGGLVFLEGMYIPGSRPLLRFFEGDEVEPTTFCGATLSGFVRMGRFAGYSSVRLLGQGGYGPIRRSFGETPLLVRPASWMARRMGHRSVWPRAVLELQY